MAVIDIIIACGLLLSIAVGVFRGVIKEALSLASLLFAIWAALYFGPSVGNVAESWLSSEELQTWFGRILIFAVTLSLGGLLGWGLSKLARLSVLSGMDRFLGAVFGVVRGILLASVFIIGGQFAGFDNDRWWQRSQVIPHLEVVAEWIKVMAPKGLDALTPDEVAESLPVQLPTELFGPGDNED